MLDQSKVADKDPEEAWEQVKRADAEGDLDDFREVRSDRPTEPQELEENSPASTDRHRHLGSEGVYQSRALDYLCSVGELFSQEQDEDLLDRTGKVL